MLSSFSNEKCFTTTNTLVAPVINKIIPISSKKIKIEWLPDEQNIKDATKYTIYLSSNGLDYRYANTVYPNQNYFVYENAQVGINYCFKIKASDDINSSEFSNEKCLTAINTLVAPVINKITPISSKKIKIEWLPNEQNIIDATNYTIYFSTNGVDYRYADNVYPNQNYFVYEYAEVGLNYCFKIKASDYINFSEFSNEKCAKTINSLLTPTLTNAEPIDINKIKVSWQSTTTPIADFNYYTINQYIDGIFITSQSVYNKNLTDFTFNNIIAGKNYCFDIQLYDGYNYSIKSNQKCAKTINTLEVPILNTVSQVTPSKFTFNWSYKAKLLSEEYLQLWRKDENGSYYNFTNLQSDAKSITDNYLKAGGKYCYKIRSAFGNNYSEFSNEICGTLVNDYKAGEITKITEISPSKIKLEWAPTTNIFNNIKLFFSENGNAYNAYNDYTIYVSDNQLSKAIINLKAGVKYCYKFQFLDEGNNSSPFSNEACFTTKNTLEPPSLTKVTALDPNEVKLEWLESTTQKDHFSEYQIFRSTDGGTFERINYAYNSQKNINISGLVSGKNYCLKIRTSDGINVSKFSNELCVVTINDLEPPTLTGATQINSNSLNLTWNASPTSINNFEYYHIYRSENDGEYKLVKQYIGRDNLSTNFDDIVAGKKYCFKILITDLNNYSKLSNEICATNVNKLEAPKLEAVNSKASNKLQVKWIIESNQNQNNYQVFVYQSTDGVNYTKLNNQGYYSWGSYLIDNLKVGKEYCYKISLFDGYNESPLSNVICGKTINDLQPPINFKVEQSEIKSLVVNWAKPQENQNIRNYQLYMKTDTGAFQVIQDLNNYYSNYKISNLKIGSKYCIKIRSSDGINFSEFSEEKCLVLENYLKPPAISSIIKLSPGSVKLTWKPSIIPQNKFDYYQIHQFSNGKLISQDNFIYKNDTAKIITTITAGIENCFKMKIVQNGIQSEYSDSVCIQTVNDLVAPTLTKLTPVNSSNFKLEWENSMPIANFQAYQLFTSFDGGNYNSGNRLYNVTNSTTINYILAGKNYCYKLKLIDGINSSPFSNEICGKTENNLVPPNLVKAELINLNQARLTWRHKQPANEFSYYYIYSKIGKGDWQVLTSTMKTDTTILVGGVKAGDENCYSIRTVNDQNFSPHSNEICLTPVNDLLPPQIIRADSINSKQVKLVWKPMLPLDKFDNYYLYRKIGNGEYGFINYIDKSKTEYIIDNVKAGEDNCFKIVCISGINKSEYSNEVCIQTKNNLKVPKFNLLTSNNNNTVTLGWQPALEGEKPAFYEIFRSNNRGQFTLVKSNVTALTIFVNTALLQENVDYCYKIRASDGVNFSEFSEEKCAKKIDNGIDVLKLISVERINFNQIKLTWEKPKNKIQGSYFKIYSKTDSQEYQFRSSYYSNDTTYNVDIPYNSKKEVCYKFCLSDNNGNQSDFSNEICIDLKLDEPNPKLIEAKRTYGTDVNLKCEPLDKFQNYFNFYLYRANEGSSNYKFVARLNAASNNFIDQSVKENVNYCYKILYSYPSNGTLIDKSNVLCVTNTPKSAPNNFKANNITCDRIELSWSDFESNFNETGFELMRSEDGANGSYKYLDLPSANVTSFIDTKVESGKTYHYALRGKFGDSFSPFTAALQVTVACNAPTNVKISKIGCTGLAITWDDFGAYNIEESYEIFRSSNGVNGNYEKIGTSGQNINYFNDVNLDVNSEVFYKIRGQFAKGYSDFSEPSGAITNTLELSKVNNGATYVNFNLINCGEGVDNWSVWQSEDGKNYKEVMLVNARESSFKVKNLIGNRTYYFVISPITKKGHSGFSNVVKLTTTDFAKPTKLIATRKGASKIKLNWQDNSNDDDYEETFLISQLLNDKTWKTIGSVGQNETSYMVDSLDTDSLYCFKVNAQYYGGYSQYTDVVCAKPSKLELYSNLENSKVIVSWNDSLNISFANTDSIKLWRKIESDSVWRLQSLINENQLSYIDSSTTTNSKYCYYLSAGKEESEPICTLTCPEIIQGFVAKSTQKGVIDIEWKQVLQGKVNVNLSYSEDGIKYIPIIFLDSKLHQLKFNIFKEGSSYWFKISTKNAVCETIPQVVKVTVANVRESAVYIPDMEKMIYSENSTIKVFPNPISDKVSIEVNAEISGNVKLQLIDSFGKVIFSENAIETINNKVYSIDTSHLPVGVYFLITHFNNHEEVFKLLKK